MNSNELSDNAQNNPVLRESKIIDISGKTPEEQPTAPQPTPIPSKKRKLSIGKMISLVLIGISVFALGGGVYLGYNVLAANNDSFGQGQEVGLWNTLTNLAGNLVGQREPIKGEEDGRTNVLILGRDGVGTGLTDSIIIGSYYHEEDKFVTVNIPRDFYIYDGYGTYKINSVYAFAEQRNPGNGEAFLADLLGEEFGIDIHYWASVDFNGLEAIVDELGGITVNVERSFIDCNYPDARMQGYLFPCPEFEAGPQQMDGRTALIYARSRKGTNGEGSDFARSRRQSIVLEAIAQKAKETGIVLNASKVNSYFDILGGTLRTNARIDEIVSGSALRDEFEPSTGFLRIVWDTSNGYLCDGANSAGLYVINYCGGAVAGRPSTNRARQQAQSVVQNMLQQAESAELFEANVALVGNLSNETDKAYNQLSVTGFENLNYNNNYTALTAATFNSVEEITIYIPDQNLRDKFNKLNGLDFEYTVEESFPSDKQLPNSAAAADIIVWVESI